MEAGTITAAGDLLGRSQPAVSRMLDRLEYELGLRLFERRKGRIIPTAEAHLLLDEVDRAFASLGSLSDFAKRLNSGEPRKLSFAVLPTLGTTFMADVLSSFCRKHPAARVSMLVSMSTSVEHAVATQQVDFGLAETPFQRTSFGTKIFIDSEYVAVLPYDHLARDRPQLTPEDLSTTNFIAWSPFVAIRRRIDDVMLADHTLPTPVVETNFSSSICELVKRGLGVAIVDPFTAFASRSPEILIRRFVPKLAFRIELMMPNNAKPHPLMGEFLAFAAHEKDRILDKLFTEILVESQ